MSGAAALFARLQLRPDADEREVRRAYARELKKIDQETQAEAFQELRETYERLLSWLRRQAEQHSRQHQDEVAEPVAPAATPGAVVSAAPCIPEVPPIAAAPAPQPAASPSPEARAREVLEAFIQRLRAQPFAEVGDAAGALARCFEDERLASVDARNYFEWGVASLLANGWQPGHERLFVAALDHFGWGADRARLLWLGRPGQVLDQALEQLAAFDLQSIQARMAQKPVIQSLRSEVRPGTSQLLRTLPLASELVTAFPAWLHVVSVPRRLEAWRRWDAEIPKWRRWLQPRPRPVKRAAPASSLVRFRRLLWVAGVFFAGAMLLGLLANPRASDPPGLSHSGPPTAFGRPVIPDQLKPPSLRDPQVQRMLDGAYRDSLAAAARKSLDYPDARALASRLKWAKASVEHCQSAESILQDHLDAFERGDFGADFDRLLVDCHSNHSGDLPPAAVATAGKRRLAVLQKQLQKELENVQKIEEDRRTPRGNATADRVTELPPIQVVPQR